MTIHKNKVSPASPQILLFMVFTILIAIGMNSAQALEIKEGKWGITTEFTMPMASTPRVEYTEDCIEEGFDPVAEMLDGGIEGCEIVPSQDSATMLDVTMQCVIPNAGTMNGKILFLVKGDTASGQVDMEMDMGGMTMNISGTWNGEYLGACTQ